MSNMQPKSQTVDLKGKDLERLLAIKKHYNVEFDQVIAICLENEFNKLKKRTS